MKMTPSADKGLRHGTPSVSGWMRFDSPVTEEQGGVAMSAPDSPGTPRTTSSLVNAAQQHAVSAVTAGALAMPSARQIATDAVTTTVATDTKVSVGLAFGAADKMVEQATAPETFKAFEPWSGQSHGLASVTDAMGTASVVATGETHHGSVLSHPAAEAFPVELATEIQLLLRGGAQRAELRLNPAELGPIRIELSIQAQTADISFSAPASLTRDCITSSLPQLADMLREQGLSLGQTHVGADTPRSWSDDRWQQTVPSVSAGTRSIDAQSAGAPWGPGPIIDRRLPQGVLDLYA